jgi:hypothetical protein
MRSAWRALAVASLSTTMLFSGPASFAAVTAGTAHPDMRVCTVDAAIETRIDALIATMSLEQKADLSGAGPLALTLDLSVDKAPTAPAMLELRCSPGCIARLDDVTAPFALSSNAPMRLTLSSIALTPVKETPCR